MTQDNPLPPSDAAAEWFARLQDERAGAEDFAAFAAWLESDPRHGEAFDRVEQLWVDFDFLDHATPAPIAQAFPRRAPARTTGTRRMSARFMAWASVAAAAAVAGIFVLTSDMTRSPTVYQTAAGERRDIALDDGTHIVLAGDSSVSVRLKAHQRDAAITKGEAVFDIADDPARPFQVAIGDQTVRDIGTVFNLSRRGAEQQITVVSGIVEVSGGGAGNVRLGPGDQLFHRQGERRSIRSRVDVAEVVAWRSGRLVFRNRSLSDVVRMLNRHLSQPLKIDEEVAALPFTGMLKLGDRGAVARQLGQLLPVRARVDGGGAMTLSAAATPPAQGADRP